MSARLRARYELRRILGSRGAVAGIAAIMVAGLVAVLLGSFRMDGERRALRTLEQAWHEQEAYLRLVYKPESDLGLITYYLWMPAAHETAPMAALAHGQRDMHPYAQQVRLLGLVPQLHQAEAGNPLARATGGFDLAFVITLLLPLLIILLAYDARSHDEDMGTLGLVRGQPVSLFRVVCFRLAVRAGLVAALALALIAAAAVWSGAGGFRTLFTWGPLTLAYMAIWFLLSLVVIAAGRSSTFNALALIGAWMLWTIALPALLAATLSAYLPVRGGVELTLAQRQIMNDGWDKPKRDTMQPFLAEHPELAALLPAGGVPEDRFSWPWYYAMHDTADRAVAGRLADYRERLGRRHYIAERAGLVLPALNLELTLSRLAGTDTTSHLAYRDSLFAYHDTLERFFHPLIFRGTKLGDLRFQDLPRHEFPAKSRAETAAGLPAGFLGGLSSLAATGLFLAVLLPAARRRMDAAGPQ